MRKALAVLIFALIAPSATAAPVPTSSPATGWDAVLNRPADRAPGGAPVETRPRRFEAFDLNRSVLRSALAGAPDEDARAARRDGAVISVPSPDGTLERFRVVSSPVLAPALARRFPQIRTYAGESLEHPGETGRFDIGPLGFHASVRSNRGLWYVDPFYKGEDGVHVAYYRDQLNGTRSPLADPGETDQLGVAVQRAPAQRVAGAEVTRRVYRLALANDPSYSTYFGNTDGLVEAAKATLMNRVNQLYSDDLAIRMELVTNDYLLNFKTATDYTNAGYASGACNNTRLTQNQSAIDSIIGPANYDIGHIVLGVDGGGIAGLGVVGKPGSKGKGCTGVPVPAGDGFAIDYVAHEMGHQFGGPHTFDGVTSSCASPNRSGAAAVEPGSGSSIQAYAGICGTDDLQPNSDPYFSQRSIDNILAYVTSGIAGATEEGTPGAVANHNPTVTAPAGRTIPVRTPFRLAGSAIDSDGDALVYLWEQNDPGGTSGQTLRTSASTKTDGPLFRVFGDDVIEDASQSPAPGQNVATAADRIRTFPDAAQIAADNTDAESGNCADTTNVDCNSEVLPGAGYATTAGAMHFRLTARDRNPLGGGVDHDDVTLAVSGSQPFAVTAPANPSAPLTGGTTTTVTWNVSGTDVAPFNAPTVRIRFSTDGGLTFNYVALDSTANDGSADVTVPNVATTQGRFEVDATDNYFFDVSDGNITVNADPQLPVTPTATPEGSPSPSASPSPSPSASPSPSPSSSPAPTSSPVATVPPTVSPSATGTPFPVRAYLRPDLSGTARTLKVSRGRTVRVRVRCVPVGTFAVAPSCAGTVRLYATRRIARGRFALAANATKRVTLKLKKSAFRRLRRGRRLKATLRTTVGDQTATRAIVLRRPA